MYLKHQSSVVHHRKKSSFTLIELLVVVAIIGILASLLLPSLGKARKKALASVCAGNLKQLGTAMIMYTDDNDQGKFPHNAFFGWTAPTVSWDDHISDYDGRDSLTVAEKNSMELDVSNESQSKLYKCPSDTVAVNGDKIKNSYGPTAFVEGNTQYQGISGGGHYGGYEYYSRSVTEINTSSESILLSENFHLNNWMGGVFGLATPGGHNEANTDNPATNPLPHNTKFNYLFVDGHAQRLGFYSTLYGSAFNAADTSGTMWDAGK